MRRRRVHRLSPHLIKIHVPKGKAGAYILYVRGKCGLRPVYTGRSDTDLRRRLLTHARSCRGTFFEFDLLTTVEQAYLLECAVYHGLNGATQNLIHPAKPMGSKSDCPFCYHALKDTRDHRINLVT